jgi:glycopeptide antibiotics resistance protein
MEIFKVNEGAAFCGSFYFTFAAMKLKPGYFIPAIIWFIIANTLFLMPGKDVPTISFLDLIYFDQWVHAGLLGGLVFLTAYPFIKAGISTKKMLIKISIIFILYGILIEFLQKYVAIDRDFDINDMIADTVGCVLGFIAANWFKRRIAKKNKPL